jgi:hypothetical protein
MTKDKVTRGQNYRDKVTGDKVTGDKVTGDKALGNRFFKSIENIFDVHFFGIFELHWLVRDNYTLRIASV